MSSVFLEIKKDFSSWIKNRLKDFLKIKTIFASPKKLRRIMQQKLNIQLPLMLRNLHEFLEVKSKFATWIQNRIQKYKFKENIDFVSVSIFLENGGRTIEYHLSTNMAKQLTMVENN